MATLNYIIKSEQKATFATPLDSSNPELWNNKTQKIKPKFRAVTAKVDSIYLTESELAAIYALNLSEKPHLDAARDVF